jgi:D-alanine-D-alanine ligase-like ATP-grasp enzyme
MRPAWSRTNQLIIAAAEALGVEATPIARCPTDFFLRLRGPGQARGVIISKTRSPFLTEVAQTLANNKYVARELLAAHGLPVIPSLLLDEAEHPAHATEAAARAQAFLAAHGRLVVKPNWGNRGIGIVTDVRDFSTLLAAFEFAREHDRDEEVLLEPQVPGLNLRVAVIGGRHVATAEIARPILRGDGRRSVAALLEALNADPRRGRWDRPSLVPLDHIEVELVAERLAASGLELDTILPDGEHLELSFEELEVIDRTDDLHPGWVDVALAAARLLGVDVAGVDLRGSAEALFELGPAERPAEHLGAGVLEVNALPALHLHALPTQGPARPVFEAFVAYCVQRPGAPAPCASVLV